MEGLHFVPSVTDCKNLFSCDCVESVFENLPQTLRNIFCPCIGTSVLLEKIMSLQMYNHLHRSSPEFDQKLEAAHDKNLASERIFSLLCGCFGFFLILCWSVAYGATLFKPDDASIWYTLILQIGMYLFPFMVIGGLIVLATYNTAKDEYQKDAIINFCCLCWPCCQPCYVTHMTEEIKPDIEDKEVKFGVIQAGDRAEHNSSYDALLPEHAHMNPHSSRQYDPYSPRYDFL